MQAAQHLDRYSGPLGVMLAKTIVQNAAPDYGVDLIELKNGLLRALVRWREAHHAIRDALRARWPEQLRV